MSAKNDAARLRITEQIRALKTDYNELAPISQLPPELLISIFKLAMYRSQKDIYELCQFSNDLWANIISVSHVCRGWRSLALDCPTLWTRIIFFNPAITREMLLRSKSSPLRIAFRYILCIESALSSFTSEALNMERLQELHLSMSLSSHFVGRILTKITGNNASQLQSLLIATKKSHSDPQYAIPSRFISLSMPCLRYLSLYNCIVPWDVMHYCISAELVYLALQYVSKPSEKQLIELLTRCPNLEKLTLKNVFPPPSAGQIPSVELRKLISCNVRGASLLECVEFQTHVSYPIETAEVYLWPPDDELVDVSALQALIASSIPHPSSYKCLMFDVSRRTPKFVLSRTSYKADSYDDVPHYDHSVTIDLSRMIVGDGARPPWLELLSIPKLETLSVCVERGNICKGDDWSDFFSRHPEITRLHLVSTPGGLPVLSALSPPAGNVFLDEEQRTASEPGCQLTPPTVYSGLYLPKLVTITMEDPDTAHPTAGVFALLHSCISKRRQSGLGLQELILKHYDWMVDGEVDMLREEVGKLSRYDRRRS